MTHRKEEGIGNTLLQSVSNSEMGFVRESDAKLGKCFASFPLFIVCSMVLVMAMPDDPMQWFHLIALRNVQVD